jgi:hypothetical protein
MLNSKYAPMVVLTILAMILVGVLGYFLAVKPQLDAASEYAAREDVVRKNTDTIKADSDKLDERRARLDAAPDLTEVTATNAPSSLDLPTFMARVGDAVRGSKVEIKAANLDGVANVDAWTVDPALRPSTSVAALFKSGVTPRLKGEPNYNAESDPVITVSADDTAQSGQLVRVDLSFVVKGRPQEILAFLRLLGAEDQRLFLLSDVQEEAKSQKDGIPTGLAPYEDGDMEIAVKGSLFLLNPDYSVLDEDELRDYTISSKVSPGEAPESADLQPGAS